MDYANIAGNPEEYGFRWSLETVHRDKPDGKVELGKAPIVIVTDVQAFDATLPGVIADSLNGSSIRVKCQGKGRRVLEQQRHVTLESFQVQILASLNGAKTRTVRTVEVQVYIGPEGERYDPRTSTDAEKDCQTAWQAHYTK